MHYWENFYSTVRFVTKYVIIAIITAQNIVLYN